MLNKRRKRIQKRLKKGYYKNSLSYTMAKNSVYRKELELNPTMAELLVKQYLEEIGISFKFQKGFVKPFHRIVDFYIPNLSTIIEVDGGYHDLIKEKDLQKDYLWKHQRGMKTIRLMNDEVYTGLFKYVLKEEFGL